MRKRSGTAGTLQPHCQAPTRAREAAFVQRTETRDTCTNTAAEVRRQACTTLSIRPRIRTTAWPRCCHRAQLGQGDTVSASEMRSTSWWQSTLGHQTQSELHRFQTAASTRLRNRPGPVCTLTPTTRVMIARHAISATKSGEIVPGPWCSHDCPATLVQPG